SLFRQPDGTYLSTNRIIVADAKDMDPYDLMLAGASGDAVTRMTHRALGDPLPVTYSHGGVSLTETATVGKDIKTLTVDVASMIVNGFWHQDGQIEPDMKACQECLAQANIKVNYNLPDNSAGFPAPQSVATNADWFAATVDSQGNLSLTQEARDVIDASGLGTNNLRVIYVPGVIKIGGPGLEPRLAVGYAFAAHVFTGNPDKSYIDTCFVTVQYPEQPFMPTHEIVHLFGEGHTTNMPWNLMNASAPPPGKVLWGKKRLTQQQVDRIRANGEMRNKLK
ncbi:MAG: hypothetical protein FWH21_03700, partial [Kiritimatiellaeota bacterium]|nr:hypothetical protein [Kiritimatiellota bacterium]